MTGTLDLPLIPTTLTGSYVQPAWLVNREKLTGRPPSRARGDDIWRVDEDGLEEAQDAATLMAIREFEEAGLDILTDGEIRRESYSNRFHTALDGIDVDNPAMVPGRSPGKMIPVPRITGPLSRHHPVEARDTEFLRRHTGRAIKMTLPGPFTLSQVSVDEHYGDEEAVVMALAEIVRQEVADLFAAGADMVQLDEPWMQARPEKAPAIRCSGDRSRLGGRRRADGRPSLFRLCLHGEGEAVRLLVPAGARCLRCRPDLHRGRAAAARPVHRRTVAVQADHGRRHRSRRPRCRDRRNRGRPGFARRWRCCRPSGSSPRRTAA